MKLTGSNVLYTPQVSQATYLFENIVVDSTGTYHVGTTHSVPATPTPLGFVSSGWLFHLQAGRIIDPSGKFVATYNTGQPFSVSGWIDFGSTYRYLQVGDMLCRSPESAPTSGLLKTVSVSCPTGSGSGYFSCDMRFLSTRIVSSGALNNYYIHGNATGYLYSSLGQYVNSGAFQFYKSYESLLTGQPLIAYVDTTHFPYNPVVVVYADNDSSNQNNKNTLDYQFNTTYGAIIGEYTLQRTGLYNSGITNIAYLDDSADFSGLFDGFWSGNNFVYSDIPASTTLNYYLSLTDGRGNPYPTSGTFTVSIPNTGLSLVSEYVTGFRLTASGEYLNVPLIATTGYYYCTGIQQSIGSLLFSSGCTGDLLVRFASANNVGTGASGILQTAAVTFNGLYSNGNKVFRTVYGYVTTSVGTGYTIAPLAIVNTGQYGSACFDVPLASGYNQAFYAPFRTSGTTDVEAGWFTGVALCQTGLVSGGLMTGYIVTGVDIYNIGTGYGATHPPRFAFIRTGENGLTKNASGVLLMNTGSVNASSDWYVEAGVPGRDPIISGLFGGTIPLIDNNLMYVRIKNSGVDVTVPITGTVSITMSNLASSPTVVVPFTYSKYYNTDPYALKKKASTVTLFTTTSDLSFLLSQNDLDSLYSAAGYTDNNWPFSEGDFDF